VVKKEERERGGKEVGKRKVEEEEEVSCQ